ncbi:MAG: histidine kinase [Dokdonia sp.]|jgi:sensor histidine kinase YesM
MKRLFKELAKAFLLGIVIFVATGLIQNMTGQQWESSRLWEFFWMNQLFSVSLYMVNMWVFTALLSRFKEGFWSIRNVGVGLLSSLVVTTMTIFVLRLFIIVVIEEVSFEQFLSNESFNQYYQSLVIAGVAVSLYYSFYYWKSKQERKVTQSRIIAGTASAKFDALKNQLDPHFLFNSLNVLTSLIDENPQQAQKFTTSLSKVYRYVLEQKNKELVSVDEELAFARTYMNLIKMRFEDSILIDIPTKATNPEAKVVPLSLQLLLENAVKHNMVTPTKKLKIKIKEQHGQLVVENNIQPKKVLKKSSGVGLQNIKQRYFLLTDRQVKIEQDQQYFRVGIPMLTQQQPMREARATYIADKKYSIAKAKVEKIKGFYVHFAIYCIMFFVFIYLNYISTSFPWAIFPIVGWGFGIVGHATEAFGWSPIFNKSWEERKIRELMDDESF